MKKIIAYILASLLFIVTLPISIIIHGVADSEYFWSDYHEKKPPPKYYTKWYNIIISPFTILGIK